MIRLQPISTSDLQHYKFMEELLIDSFPPEEYRQLEQLREYTDRTGNFHNNIILQLFKTPDCIGSRTSGRGNGKTTYQFLSTSRLYTVEKRLLPASLQARRRFSPHVFNDTRRIGL